MFDDPADGMSKDLSVQVALPFSSGGQLSKSYLGWRMAVLPFRAAGTAVASAIALGLAEEISAAISRFGSPRLIAPATFWDGTGPAEDVLGRARLYDLDYVMEGTLEVDDDVVRTRVVLLDVMLGFEVIWTGHLTGTLDDLFSLQHRIAAEVVRQLDPDLFQRGPELAPPLPTSFPVAHRLVLTAISGIYRLDRHRFTRARDALTAALALDPDYAAAHAWLAYWSLMAVGLGWSGDDPRLVITLAGHSAERAIDLDPQDARAHAIAGHVKAYLQRDVAAALKLHARAIALNPNLPIAWTMSSASQFYNGDHATAIRHANTARALSPRDPHIYWAEHNATIAYFLSKNLEQAEILSDIVLSRNPDHVSAINIHVGILGHTRQITEAQQWISRLKGFDPDLNVRKIVERAPFRPQDRDYYAEGLRRAGLPD
jgi:TolB-like protein